MSTWKRIASATVQQGGMKPEVRTAQNTDKMKDDIAQLLSILNVVAPGFGDVAAAARAARLR